MRFTLSLLFTLTLAATALGQRSKLEGHVYDGNNVARPNVNILVAGGEETTTKEKGYFKTILPDAHFIPGQPITIHVNGWKVFDPMFGHYHAQDASFKEVLVRVTIIRPNSIAAHKDRRRLSAIVEEYAKKVGGLSTAVRALQNELMRKDKNLTALNDQVNKIDQELGKYTFLRKYSEEYEVPLDEIKAAIDNWARSRKADSDLERARQAFWNGDEAEVLKLTKSILEVKTKFAKLRREETLKENAKVIEAYRLRTGVFINQKNFREAYANFKELTQLFDDRTVAKEDFTEDWAAAQLGVGFATLALLVDIDREGKEKPELMDKSRADLMAESLAALRKAESFFTPQHSPELWAIMASLLAVAPFYDDLMGLKDSNDITRLREARAALKAVLNASDQGRVIITPEKFPGAWFVTHIFLGGMLMQLGDQSQGPESIGYLREAVTIFETMSKSFDREKFPTQWATGQNGLSNALIALGHHTQGAEGVGHLRRAVEASRAVLKATSGGVKVYTPEKFPGEWSLAQGMWVFALGELSQRSEWTDAVERLREAAEFYRDMLKATHEGERIYTPEKNPALWLSSQKALAKVLVALGRRTAEPGGTQHLREAVKVYGEILSASRDGVKIFTVEKTPREWVSNQIGLATSLFELGRRTQGPVGIEHLRESVATHKAVSSVGGKIITPEKFPVEWALNQSSLGLALFGLARRTGWPDGVEHLRGAVKVYKEFLEVGGPGGKVYTPEQFGEGWARAQFSLAETYAELSRWTEGSGGVEHLRGAAGAYRAVLEAGSVGGRIFTPESSPREWWPAQNGLGRTLIELSRRTEGPVGVEHLREAVKASEAVLNARRAGVTIYTPEQFPHAWAWAQINLAMASGDLAHRVEGPDSLSYLNKVTASATAVLEASHAGAKIYTPERFPAEWATAQHLLAESYVALKKWTAARDTYAGILQVFPDDRAAHQKLGWLYHEVLFQFEQAFALQQQWLARHKDDLPSQADFAEAHFTVARFSECGQHIARLLTSRDIPAEVKTALRALEIANLLALNQDDQVPGKLDALIAEVRLQPASFSVDWTFDGTKYFIAHNEKLKPHRAWLGQLFDAFEVKKRDALLNALLEAQVRSKRRFRQR